MAFFISIANKPNLQLHARSLNVFVFVFFSSFVSYRLPDPADFYRQTHVPYGAGYGPILGTWTHSVVGYESKC